MKGRLSCDWRRRSIEGPREAETSGGTGVVMPGTPATHAATSCKKVFLRASHVGVAMSPNASTASSLQCRSVAASSKITARGFGRGHALNTPLVSTSKSRTTCALSERSAGAGGASHAQKFSPAVAACA